MPRSMTEDLLGLLSRIEHGQAWPEQLLRGIIMNLDKENSKAGVLAFRPICILSVIFRTWSSIRTRQLLAQIAQRIGSGTYGYLPKREAKEVCFAIQAAIELASVNGEDLMGFSTDLVAAFNTLPRKPVFHAATKLGMPPQLVNAWGRFLDGLERFFSVNGNLSQPIRSSAGFPEGDPMSTVAMTVVDWAWELYMHQYAPGSVPLSFVDNYSCMGRDAATLAQALTCTRCFADLWGLELDPSKTFAWALHPHSRRTLKALQLSVVDSAKDLGGLFSYGSKVRTRLQEDACKALNGIWGAMQRSRAPKHQKEAMLISKAWPKALHGSTGCVLSESRLSHLRAQAVRAIGGDRAGSSSALRLVFGRDMTGDPGLYQLWHLVCDLRRIAAKQGALIEQWGAYVQAFDGKYRPGPFSSLLQLCTRIGWHVAPPFLVSAAGFRVDLFRAPKRLIRKLIEQDWANMVVCQHRHRKTMHSLDSVDLGIVHLDGDKLTALEYARVKALQTGCYIASAQHALYDVTKTGECTACRVPDTVEHKVRFCGKFQGCRPGCEATLAAWQDLPHALTHHLLMPQNPWVNVLFGQFSRISRPVPQSVVVGSFSAWVDLFTDGTCLFQGDFALAAWAVVDATKGQALEAQPLAGMLQTVPRAELEAALFAARWGEVNKQCTHIWTDSKYVCDGFQSLLSGLELSERAENADLWEQVEMVLQGFPTGCIGISHVPSHLDPELCESEFELWVARWNNFADQQADWAESEPESGLCHSHGSM